MKKRQPPKFPIVSDYIRKLKAAKATRSSETRRRLRWEANQLLSVMTAIAAQSAIDQAIQENL